MTESTEFSLKLALCLVSAVALLVHARRGPRREAGAMLTGLAIVGLAAALTNFFTFHEGLLPHSQEMFHYQLGAKYFPELGYTGLYEASVAAQVEARPDLPLPGTIRDLESNVVVPATGAIARRAETIARFTPARWKSFVADHAVFAEAVAVAFPDTRIDHGYNPTPTWTFVGRLFNAWVPLTSASVTLLALLDWVLIGVVVWTVSRTYGGGAAATLAILLGLAYPWRHAWVGGSFLRYDWFAALAIGVCMLKRGRSAWAGALFAYAAAVRIFPVLLLAGLGVVAVRDLVRRRDVRWTARFAAGFAGCLAACLLAGALAGRGPGAWAEFARNIKKHNDTWSLNTVGMELLVLYPPTVLLGRPEGWPLARDERYSASVDSAARGGYDVRVPALGAAGWSETVDGARVFAEEAIARSGERWQAAMVNVQETRRPIFLVAAALFVGAVLLAAWQRERDEAVVLGVAAVFALLHLSSYYWVLLALMALRGDRLGARGSVALLGLSAATFAVALVTPVLQVIYLGFTWGLAILLAAWLAPDVLATLRGRTLAPAVAAAPVTRALDAKAPPRRKPRRARS